MKVKLQPLRVEKVENLCGLDVSYNHTNAVAVAVLWSLSHQKVVSSAEYQSETAFPYVSGLLFMREGPLMLSALRKLSVQPDLIMVDGHGIAHPRKAGLAVFIGLLTDIPTIGVAKSLLVGTLGEAKGSFSPIFFEGLKVGYALRTRSGRRLYVSPGHRVRLQDIVKIFRIIGSDYPIPLKEAHRISKDKITKNIFHCEPGVM